MTDATPRQKALATHRLLKRYYVDDSDQVVGDHKVEQYNTVLGMITYATARRQLLKGDPGSGKTSIAGTLCGVVGGTPPNVAAQMLVPGNPGISEEDISGRLHYGKMAKGEEKVIWHTRHTLPFFSVDELLRVPTKKQSYLLRGVEDGHWEVIDYPLDVGPRPGFFTINPKDSGSFELTFALQERLSVATEHLPLTWSDQERKEEVNERRSDELYNSEITSQMFALSEKSEIPFAEKMGEMSELRARYRAEVLSPLLERQNVAIRKYLADEELTDEDKDFLGRVGSEEEKGLLEQMVADGMTAMTDEDVQDIRKEIKGVPLSQEANLFGLWLETSMNTSNRFGVKRYEDTTQSYDEQDPDANYAAGWIETPLLNRAQSDLRLYAKGLAWWLGDEEVTIEHLREAAVATLNHRIEFTDMYEGQHSTERRTEDLNTHLTRKMIEEVAKDFDERGADYISILSKLSKDPESLTERQLEMVRSEQHPIMAAARRQYGIEDVETISRALPTDESQPDAE